MLLTLVAVSSRSSSASSAEALAPISVKHVLVCAHCPGVVVGCGLRDYTNLDGALGDHGAVGLEDDAIDLLQVVRVRDDLVVGEDVLWIIGSATVTSVDGGNAALWTAESSLPYR